ncbi:MAG: MaoC family dehydratase N-terminal domain-containing protein [Deltaproteobacteria bacterium]|nr:MaoC family dehydratase N-terminal domain-containing protein [Deltaproteobacteria bacterium]MBW2395838.1 MaoC family dehydratase N-terminal domain-containing protein [Deltaproteobacteria bacterium]
MPISSEIVGRRGEPLVHGIDARWTMAYAAGLGDLAPAYLDTLARSDVLAHPLFPVCFEWPLFLDPRCMPTDLETADRIRGVHASHDLRLHRPVRAGMELTTRATLAKVEARRSGAYQLARLDTIASDGEPVSTTWYGMLYRDVEVAGDDRSLEDTPAAVEPAPADDELKEHRIAIAPNAALVYTECARIWNPIHTDTAVAKAAGLPEPILHGTATLALAVSRVVAECFDGDAERVSRIAARFGAMVRMPSTLSLRIGPVRDNSVRFEVLEPEGGRAIRDGLLTVRR